MDWWQAIVLAILQGLTEFLPISSSAHLILPSQVLGWPDQGLAFDVAVHVGTLLAVVGYFRRDIGQLIYGWVNSTFKGQRNSDGTLAWWIALATIPAGLAGILLNDYIEAYCRQAIVIATTTIVFGLLLLYADRRQNLVKQLTEMPLIDAIMIGCSQALALIPGTSRSGITMTAAMLLGYDRKAAARFSFLLSIPLITAAGGLKSKELIEQTQTLGYAVPWDMITLGAVVSCISAYVCIHFFLKVIEKMSMMPFVVYRLALGTLLLAGLGFGFIA